MSTTVSDPVLDTRDEGELAAQAVGALPSELSDRSDSNPAVVIIEAASTVVGKLLYQINRWPSGVIQKALALVGVTLTPAVGATVTQSFTLSAPQASDTVIPTGTQVSIADGSVVFATLADLTISAYSAPAGTVQTTAGSTAIVGAGTAFVLGSTWVGYQIQIPQTTGPWMTIASVADATHLTLVSAAPATVAAATWYIGQLTGTVQAQATTTGTGTNVGATKLTTLASSPAFVASTTNTAAASGGAEIETTDEAITRAPIAFAARDVAITVADYAYFAQRTLGAGGRASAKANWNTTAAASGYTSVACLSPAWTAATPVGASERAAVVRDLSPRAFSGATVVDVAASIYSPTTAAIVYRKAAFAAATTQTDVAAAINTYLSPNTYPWGRIIYTNDLVQAVEAVTSVDRVHDIMGVACVGAGYSASPAAINFVFGVAAANTADTTGVVANRTVLYDAVNGKAYLVRSFVPNASVTLDRVYESAANTQTPNRFQAVDDDMAGGSTTPLFNALPYSALSVTTAPPSIIVLGAV